MRKRTLTLLSILIVLAVAVGVVVIYLFLTHRVLYVPSGSMMNTVIPGDRLFARRFSADPKRGQVIVFQYPGDSTFYLGRIIGMPNETVDIRDTLVYINRNNRVNEQQVLVESPDAQDQLKEVATEGNGRYKVFYSMDASERNYSPEIVGPHVVPVGHYFVMGDNRDNSEDSRYRGPVPRELIWGEAFRIYFSTDVKSGDFRSDRFLKSVQ